MATEHWLQVLSNHQVTRSAKLNRSHWRWNYNILGHVFMNHETQKVKWDYLLFETTVENIMRQWPHRAHEHPPTHTHTQVFDSKYFMLNVCFMLHTGMITVKITNTLYRRYLCYMSQYNFLSSYREKGEFPYNWKQKLKIRMLHQKIQLDTSIEANSRCHFQCSPKMVIKGNLSR